MQLLAETTSATSYLTEKAQLWADIWFWVLVLGGAAFLCILAYSIIAGAFDIKQLFAALQATEDEARSNASAPGAASPSDNEPEARE